MNAYEFLGEEAGIRRLVDRFYDEMERLPEAATIRAMHPPDLAGSRERLHLFLVERFGGPPVYSSVRGHPMLRRRHLPFRIDAAAEAAWMACMDRALEAQVPPGPEREELRAFFAGVAAHMRNG